MALLDANLKKLPGATKELGVLFAGAALEAALVLGQALSLATALSSLWWGESLVSQAGMLALFACCFALREVVGALRKGRIQRYADATSAMLRDRIACAVYDEGPNLVSRRGTGSLVSTLIEGVDQVRTYIALVLPKTADLLVIPLLLGVALLCIDPISGVICLVIIPVIMFYMQMLGANSKDAAAAQFERFTRLSNNFTDTLRGVSTVHAFGRGAHYEKRIWKASERLRKATNKTLKSAFTSSLVMDLFRVFALAAVAIMLGFRLLAGDAELQPALAVLVMVPELFAAIRRYSQDFHAGLDGANQLASLVELLGADTLAQEAPAATDASGVAAATDTSVEVPCAAGVMSAVAGVPAAAQSAPALVDVEAVRFVYHESDGDHVALDGVNLHILPGQKLGIVGASGSGKSTLVNMIAGFAAPSAGTVALCGQSRADLMGQDWRQRVIYIPQAPHVFYGTIRYNVSFYQPDADDARVWEGLEQAGLAEFVRGLEAGLDTVVGQGARTLSGGQAQRLALARAFLCDSRDVLILDEPTAHLDVETEYALKQCMVKLFEGRTVIMATHRLHWLDQMDWVVRLEQGRIAEQGPADRSAEGEASRVGGHGVRGESRLQSESRSQPQSQLQSQPQPEPQSQSQPQPQPEAPQPSWTEVWKHDAWARPCLKHYTGELIKSLALGVLAMVFAAGLMFMAGYVISAAAERPELGLFAILVPLGLVQVFGIGKPLISYAERLMSHDWVLRLVSRMRAKLFREIESDGALWADTHRTGDALGMLADDLGHVQDLYLRCVFPLVTALVVWLLAAVLYGFVSLGCALFVLVGLLALSVVPCVLSARRLQSCQAQDKRLKSEMYAAAVDDVEGLADWRFSLRRDDYVGRINQAHAKLAASSACQDAFNRRRDCVVSIAFGLMVAIICVFVAVQFGQMPQGNPAAGASSRPADWMAAFVLGFFPLLETFLPLSDAVVGAYGHKESLIRLNQVSEASAAASSAAPAAPAGEPAPVEGASPAAPAEDVAPAAPAAPAGDAADAIAVEDLEFGYEPERDILKRLDLRIPAGQHVAILGPSGCGKTTLLRLIQGDLQPRSGRVLVEGTSSQLLAVAGAMPQHIGVISQETYLFNQSLYENLTLGDSSITPQRCRWALESVGLKPLLERLPEGLDTMVNEAGLRFSGGERHRIGLARVLLRDVPVVILDEPTVSLDPATEQALLETVMAVLQGRTVVMVTHHLAGVELMDRVVFMEHGGVVLDGSVEHLLETSPRFANLLGFDQGKR